MELPSAFLSASAFLKKITYIFVNGTVLYLRKQKPLKTSFISEINFRSSKNEIYPLFMSSWYLRKRNFLVLSLKSFLYFRKELARHENKKILIFLLKHKRKRRKFLILFVIKKFHFFIIIIKRFFSLYNKFFYTEPVYSFNLLRDFVKMTTILSYFFLFLL